MAGNEVEALKRLRRRLDVLGSHSDGLRQKAEAQYQAGNVEQYEAYAECIEYCEGKTMDILTALGVILERVRRTYGIGGEGEE